MYRSSMPRFLMRSQCTRNDRDKNVMIHQMDQIYSDAVLSIVDAAGEDASHGFPGVGKATRTERCGLRLENLEIHQVETLGYQQLEPTKWATRGWTYQEGYLSKRRLIFTNHEAHFLFNEMHHPEYSTKPFSEFKQREFGYNFEATQFQKFTPPPIRGPETINIMSSKILDQIHEYISQQLSYEEDILNAFQEILR
jgi:hypothetical protein